MASMQDEIADLRARIKALENQLQARDQRQEPPTEKISTRELTAQRGEVEQLYKRIRNRIRQIDLEDFAE
ncbi:MAG: hypothetical protein ACE5LS_07305 [Thermoplasmata archaeon]